MKHKTLLTKLKQNGWNMRFDAREQALIKDIAEITEKESNQVQAVVKVNFADMNKIINESIETAKLEMNASEHPSVYSYFEGQISVLETLQHKLSKISA